MVKEDESARRRFEARPSCNPGKCHRGEDPIAARRTPLQCREPNPPEHRSGPELHAVRSSVYAGPAAAPEGRRGGPDEQSEPPFLSDPGTPPVPKAGPGERG